MNNLFRYLLVFNVIVLMIKVFGYLNLENILEIFLLIIADIFLIYFFNKYIKLGMAKEDEDKKKINKIEFVSKYRNEYK